MDLLGRITAAAALAPWLVVSSALVPEHVHEPGSTDHHASVAHRHFSPHDHDQVNVSHLDHDDAEVEGPDEHVVWLDEAGIAEAIHSFHVTLLVGHRRPTSTLGSGE